MEDCNLLPNEAIIMRSEGVYHPVGKKEGAAGELILTNLNIIYIRKGLFNKEILKFPLNQIKIINGQVQAVLEKRTAKVDIFFYNGQEIFNFCSSGKKEAINWLDKISELLTGHPANIDDNERSYIPGITEFADNIKNTVVTFKEAMGIREIETLKKIKELLDAGILIQEEFDAKKKEIMNL